MPEPQPRYFSFPCPDCWSELSVHEPDCEWPNVPSHRIEKAYVDIISTLIQAEVDRNLYDVEAEMDTSYDWLTDAAPEWSPLHTACLAALKRRYVVIEDATGNLRHVPPDDRQGEREPTFGAIKRVYQYGACDGCLDYGTCAMVSWCEMNDYTWDETVEFVVEWLHETGTWERGSFEEPTPEALVADKRHVYRDGIGWKNFAETTVATMRDRGHIPDHEEDT